MRARVLLLASSLMLTSMAACGRTDFGDYGTSVADYEVQVTREVVLDDDNVVLVELAAPTPEAAEAALMALQDGTSIDDLVVAITPEGDRDVFAVADAPVQVRVDGTLRAVIWR